MLDSYRQQQPWWKDLSCSLFSPSFPSFPSPFFPLLSFSPSLLLLLSHSSSFLLSSPPSLSLESEKCPLSKRMGLHVSGSLTAPSRSLTPCVHPRPCVESALGTSVSHSFNKLCSFLLMFPSSQTACFRFVSLFISCYNSLTYFF